MKISKKWQVTVPKIIRERYGIFPGTEVCLVEEDHQMVLKKVRKKAK